MNGEDRGDPEALHRPAPFDRKSLQKILGGDGAAAAALLSAFARDVPGQLARLHEALERNETAQVRLMAHTLKGSLLWIGAEDAATAASLLERAAAGEPGVSPREGLATLSRLVARVLIAIAIPPDDEVAASRY